MSEKLAKHDSDEVDAVPDNPMLNLVLSSMRDVQRSVKELSDKFDSRMDVQAKVVADHDRELQKLVDMKGVQADHETRIRVLETAKTESGVKMGLIGAVAGMVSAGVVTCFVGAGWYVITHSTPNAPSAQVGH